MPRQDAYVCCLTETVVQRIEAVLLFMKACEIPKERMEAAREIARILRSPEARRGIGPKAKVAGSKIL